jgi:hypothetical protein
VTPAAEALDELRGVATALDPAATALTPTDACPDNNIETTDGLVLVDFESAAVRPVVWDLADLLVCLAGPRRSRRGHAGGVAPGGRADNAWRTVGPVRR